MYMGVWCIVHSMVQKFVMYIYLEPCKRNEHMTTISLNLSQTHLLPLSLKQEMVQEVIKDTGHLCIFLPKYYCELNFIEFFQSMVKKYLCKNSDYTFETLKTNMPLALASVQVAMIRQWEHHMQYQIEAYWGGMETYTFAS